MDKIILFSKLKSLIEFKIRKIKLERQYWEDEELQIEVKVREKILREIEDVLEELEY